MCTTPEVKTLPPVYLPQEAGLKTNRFLSLVMNRLRQGRAAGSARDYGCFIEKTMLEGKPFDLHLCWFVTKGCSNDAAGGCTMCNFGLGNVSPRDLLWQVDRILEEVQGDEIIYITPLGSMFDDNEVPEEVRNEIFKRIARTGCAIFGTESRPDMISEEKMRAFRAAFPPDMKLQIGLGMESANDYVRRNCINKRLSKEDIVSAIETLHRYDIEALVHVLLKPPFLTEAEAIEDAVQSCNFAFAQGANRVVFFMTNLKPYTLTAWLAERGRYRVPYLWSAVSVLERIGAGMNRPVTLSGFYSGVEIQELANNCEACSPWVISTLQAFSQTLDGRILDSILEKSCSCGTEWQNTLKVSGVPLAMRLREEYEYIARSVFGSQWWGANRDWVLAELNPERIS